MKINVPLVNEKGQKLLELYDRVRVEEDPLVRESMSEMAFKMLTGQQLLRRLFRSGSRKEFQDRLAITASFRVDKDTLFQALSDAFVQWAADTGFGPYDLDYRPNGRLSGFLAVQRRIAVKASRLEELVGGTVDWKAMMRDGSVRRVLLEGFGMSILHQAMDEIGPSGKKQLSYEIRVRTVRNHMICAEIVFYLPVEILLKEENEPTLQNQLRLMQAVNQAITEKATRFQVFC